MFCHAGTWQVYTLVKKKKKSAFWIKGKHSKVEEEAVVFQQVVFSSASVGRCGKTTWTKAHTRTHTHTHTVVLSLTESRPHVCSEVLSSQRACVISQLQLWLQWRWDILTWKVRLHILSNPTSHKPQAAASAAQLAATSNTNKLE